MISLNEWATIVSLSNGCLSVPRIDPTKWYLPPAPHQLTLIIQIPAWLPGQQNPYVERPIITPELIQMYFNFPIIFHHPLSMEFQVESCPKAPLSRRGDPVGRSVALWPYDYGRSVCTFIIVHYTHTWHNYWGRLVSQMDVRSLVVRREIRSAPKTTDPF